MPPAYAFREVDPEHPTWDGSWKAGLTIEGFVLESWSQGFMLGALVIMAGITVANMRTDILLHKLILIEQVLAMFHGTFCFMDFTGYGWYVSSTAVLLYSSWYLHNIIAWMKTKPFLRPWYSRLYIYSFLLTTPYWITETYGNFAFNNNINRTFLRTRPFEALCRDPWWIFTILNLIYNVRRKYNFGIFSLMTVSPRFGILLISMLLSIIFLIVDVLSATGVLGGVVGINPYWKLSLVFKCFCDTIILDDFRSALDKIRTAYFTQVDQYGAHHQSVATFADGTSRKNTRPMDRNRGVASVPKMYAPRISSEQERPMKGKGGYLSGLFGGGGHSHTDSTESTNHILVSTDIVLNEQKAKTPPSKHGSRKSSYSKVPHAGN